MNGVIGGKRGNVAKRATWTDAALVFALLSSWVGENRAAKDGISASTVHFNQSQSSSKTIDGRHSWNNDVMVKQLSKRTRAQNWEEGGIVEMDGAEGYRRHLPTDDVLGLEIPTNSSAISSNVTAQYLFATSVSGTYKGVWLVDESSNHTSFIRRFWDDVPKPLKDSSPTGPSLLRKHSHGEMILQLVVNPAELSGVHYVHGELVLRDGEYIRHDDIHIVLEGVFIPQLGHLRVVMASDVSSDLFEEATRIAVGNKTNYKSYNLNASSTENIFQKSYTSHIPGSSQHCQFRMFGQISPVILDYSNMDNSDGPSRVLKMSQLGLDGIIESVNCDIGLRISATTIALDSYYNKIINYTLMITAVSFVQVLLIIRQMDYSNTTAQAAKVSLITIGHQAVMDAYLCLLHLTAGIVVDNLFNAFATAAFFKFVIFSIFEMRYLLAIWKARRPSNFEGWHNLRRELSVLYSRFYGFLLGGIVVIYNFQRQFRFMLFLLYSFWIPQIVHNILADVRKPLHPLYVCGITFTRLLIPLYLYGCPHNFMRIEPSHLYLWSLVGYMSLQCLILLVQHFFGPRCFLPPVLFPNKYNYFRSVDVSQLLACEPADLELGVSPSQDGLYFQCVICMGVIEIRRHRRYQSMLTPCNHLFHAQCLQKWMDVKMECPICRENLPSA